MMLNLLTSSQIRDADAHTVATKSSSSLDLMEAASLAFVKEFQKKVTDKNILISMYCGTGNNGGDGLAVARILKQHGYENITVKIARLSGKSSDNFNVNLVILQRTETNIIELSELSAIPHEQSDIIIDALLGSGFNKSVEGQLKRLIESINRSQKKVISIDVPSGFPSEGMIAGDSTVIKAALVISFQRPKINFFFPESALAVERFKYIPIGLDEDYIQSLTCNWKLIEEEDIVHILKPRKPFSHKGTFGHALIIGGSKETMGAALLCAEACLQSGTGLTTACIPESGITALNTRSPEIMALIRNKNIPFGMFDKYSAIAIGPGLGTDEEASDLFEKVLDGKQVPIVLDADVLSILAKTPELFKKLPAMSILTPHMKEFDRMFGKHNSWWERVETARQKAAEFNVIILLKNQYSFIVLPDGDVLINPSGNPAMAVGGMGDVLTGMITAFLAQGYAAKEAAILGCYLHGKAGDELSGEGMNSIAPGILINRLPYTIGGVLPRK